MATVEHPRSMNDANDRDPQNNNCYGTLVDRDYVEVKLPVLGRDRLQRAGDPRLRGRARREGAAGRPGGGAVVGAGGNGGAARFQLRGAGDSRVHPRELHGLHGLRHRMPRHGDLGQSDRRIGPRRQARRDRQRRRPAIFRGPVVQAAKVLRRARRKRGSTAGGSPSSSTPSSARAAPSASPSATTTR